MSRKKAVQVQYSCSYPQYFPPWVEFKDMAPAGMEADTMSILCHLAPARVVPGPAQAKVCVLGVLSLSSWQTPTPEEYITKTSLVTFS